MKPQLLCALGVATSLASLPVDGAAYKIVDLGTNAPADLNDNGDVVGTDSLGRGWYYHAGTTTTFTNVVAGGYFDPEQNMSFYYYDGILTALKINNQDHVSGIVSGGKYSLYPRIFFYQAMVGGGHEFPRTNTLNVFGSFPLLVLNDSDRVAVSYYADGVVDPTRNVQYSGLASPPLFLNINSLNNSGVFAGEAAEGPYLGPFQKWFPSYAVRACIVTNHTLQYLDPRLPDTNRFFSSGREYLSQASGVNSKGHVIGTRYDSAAILNGGFHRAFRWEGNDLEELSGLAGQSSAIAINDADQVIGHLESAEFGRIVPFLWENGAAIELNSLLPTNSGWVLQTAVDINNRGEIIGTGIYEGEFHAFLLSPSAPHVTSPPVHVTLLFHQAYRISPQVNGFEPLSYQWIKDDSVLTNQTNPYLDIASADASSVGQYQLVVTNGQGSTTNQVATITVLDVKLSISPRAETSAQLTMEGEVGGQYRLEYALQPGPANTWTPLATLTFTNATQIYTDTTIGGTSQRFYRGVRLP